MIVLNRHGEGKYRALVGVTAHYDVYVIVLAGFIELVLIVGYDISVDYRPEVFHLCAVDYALCVDRSHLFDVFLAETFLKLHSGFFSSCKSAHGRVAVALFGHGPERASALTDGAPEQAFAQRRSTQYADRYASGRLAGYGDFFRVAAKCTDIFMYPLECGYLVEYAVVARQTVA